jgi:hypothetical protein
MLAFERGPIDVVVSLGLGDGIIDEAGDLLEVGLPLFEIADHQLKLGETVEQSGQPLPGIVGEFAIAGNHILNGLAVMIIPQSQAIVGPHRTGMQIMSALERRHRFVEFVMRLTDLMPFGLQIEHVVALLAWDDVLLYRPWRGSEEKSGQHETHEVEREDGEDRFNHKAHGSKSDRIRSKEMKRIDSFFSSFLSDLVFIRVPSVLRGELSLFLLSPFRAFRVFRGKHSSSHLISLPTISVRRSRVSML